MGYKSFVHLGKGYELSFKLVDLSALLCYLVRVSPVASLAIRSDQNKILLPSPTPLKQSQSKQNKNPEET